MPASPALSTSSSFSSVSSRSSDSASSSNRNTPKPVSHHPIFRMTRPVHKRTISDFTSSQPKHPQKIRKTTLRNKNILLWPSQLHSLDVASKEAKQKACTSAMSRESSIQSNTSIQDDPVILGYMALLRKQQKQDLASVPALSQANSRQQSPNH